ncbi:MAG TPA: hypothetical protein VGD56_13595 [Gemmatirosa sp.]
MLQWLRRVIRTVPLALAAGVLWLVASVALLVMCCAGLSQLFGGAGWLWLRMPTLLAVRVEWFGFAAAGLLVPCAAGVAADAVRALPYGIDSEVERRIYVWDDYRLPRVVQAPRPW